MYSLINKSLLSPCSVDGIVPGAEDSVVNKLEAQPHGIYILGLGYTDDKHK